MSTLLDEALTPANLRQAWDAVADNQGIAGVDDLSIGAWRRDWEERLVKLADDVRRGRYQPKKLRRRRIPKAEEGKFRILRIPTVTDRVLQRAVLETIYPVFESKFLDCSFGYRPGRGIQDAVECILVLRENGYRWALDADIDDFFNQVDLNLLLEFLENDLPDDSLLPLLEAWLEVGAATRTNAPLRASGEANAGPGSWRGIPLGSPLSPLLANILLHRLDESVMQFGFRMVRYADDFIVFAENGDRARQAYLQVGAALERLNLRYEPDKTQMTTFDEGFSFLGVGFLGDSFEYTWENRNVRARGSWQDGMLADYFPQGY